MRRRQQQPSSEDELRIEINALHQQHRMHQPSSAEEAPTRPAEQRWRPSNEQLAILDEIYAQDTKPDITEVATLIGQHDESKVYYWFQNKRSREKHMYKRRKIEAAAAAASGSAGEATAISAGMQPSASSGLDQLQPLTQSEIDSFPEMEAIDLAASSGAGSALFDPELGRIIPTDTDEHGVAPVPEFE